MLKWWRWAHYLADNTDHTQQQQQQMVVVASIEVETATTYAMSSDDWRRRFEARARDAHDAAYQWGHDFGRACRRWRWLSLEVLVAEEQ